MTGLHLIAAGHTRALRRAVFGGDDPLDEGGHRAALALDQRHRRDPCVIAPSRAAHQTAVALGITAYTVNPQLADPDYGTWTGRTLDQIEPAELQTWIIDPTAAPHGGESLTETAARTAAWLQTQPGRTVTAIAHPMIIRTLLAAALELPADSIRRLEVAPLAVTRLTHHGRWHLHFP